MGQILANQSPRDAASMLIELARQRARGGGDNISLAVVKLVEVPPKVQNGFPVLSA
jgi:serine/threonine protein phosphatase PrpC